MDQVDLDGIQLIGAQAIGAAVRLLLQHLLQRLGLQMKQRFGNIAMSASNNTIHRCQRCGLGMQTDKETRQRQKQGKENRLKSSSLGRGASLLLQQLLQRLGLQAGRWNSAGKHISQEVSLDIWMI